MGQNIFAIIFVVMILRNIWKYYQERSLLRVVLVFFWCMLLIYHFNRNLQILLYVSGAVLLASVVMRLWKSKSDAGADADTEPAAESAPAVGTGAASGNVAEADPRARIAEFPGFARQHVDSCRKHHDVELAYTEESFAKLDALIAQNWGEKQPALLEPVILHYGSFVGECIIALQGGTWGFDVEHGYCIEGVGPTQCRVFPFAKVRKRLLNGDADSLATYFTSIKQTQNAPPGPTPGHTA